MSERRAFSASVFVFYSGALPCLLLIEHKLLGLWLPFGGELEPGETPFEAARRELREESGFEEPAIRYPITALIAGAPPGFLGYEEHDAGSKGLHMNFNFVAFTGGMLEPKGDGSWKSYQWFTKEQLAALARDGKTTRNVARLASVIFRRL